MDLTKAISPNPDEIMMPTKAALLSMTNSGADGKAESDGDQVGPAQAAIKLATFVIIFSLGAILLRFLESVEAHYITRTIGVLAAVVGVGVGIYLNKLYNHVGHSKQSSCFH
jgi:hypothetical protein